MTMPNFLIIGAMKSGTTALYYYLEQHPQVYMSPVKEPNFFAFEGEKIDAHLPGDSKGINRSSVTDIGTYRTLFDRVSNESVFGEASHWYLYSAKASGRIKSYIPNVKMIAILRNPVDRAYSHFLHTVRTGTEHLTDFAEALREEGAGVRDPARTKDYVGRGFYYEQLERYFERFERDQIKIYLYEDLKEAPFDTLRQTFQFLNIDETFVADVSLRRNVSGFPKNKYLDNLLRKPHPIKHVLKLYLPIRMRQRLSRTFDTLKTKNLVKPPPLRPEVRQELIEVYREDISKLQALIQRDLSSWLR